MAEGNVNIVTKLFTSVKEALKTGAGGFALGVLLTLALGGYAGQSTITMLSSTYDFTIDRLKQENTAMSSLNVQLKEENASSIQDCYDQLRIIAEAAKLFNEDVKARSLGYSDRVEVQENILQKKAKLIEELNLLNSKIE